MLANYYDVVTRKSGTKFLKTIKFWGNIAPTFLSEPCWSLEESADVILSSHRDNPLLSLNLNLNLIVDST